MEDLPSSETSYVATAGSSSEPGIGTESYLLDVGEGYEQSSHMEEVDTFSPSTIMHTFFGKLEIVPVDPQRMDLTRGEFTSDT